MPHIRVDPELQALIPPLSETERAGLRQKLIDEGCRERLATWENDPDNPDGETLVDGHHRYEVCQDLSISFQTRKMRFSDRDAVKRWMVVNQLSRRNLTDDQRAALAYVWQQAESETAKKGRAKAAAESRWVGPEEECLSAKTPTSIEEAKNGQKRDIREEAAAEAHVTPAKVRAVAQVAKDNPAAVAEIAAGRQTIRGAKRAARQKAKPKAAAQAEPGTNGDAKPLAEWEQVAAAVDGFVSALESIARDMRKAFAIQQDQITLKAAQRYTRTGTVGTVNALVRYLKENKPVGEDTTGIITAADEKKREALAAQRAGRKAS